MNKIINVIILLALLHSINGKTQDEESFKQLIIPESGIWWNPEQSGTGASMQFSKNGTWFVILYLYDNNGEPIFYTLQGDSLEFSLDRTDFPDYAYAKASGVLRKNVNGRCLGCDYQSPQSSELFAQAEILFFQKGSARITYHLESGTFTEDLTTKLLPNDGFSDIYNEKLQTVHFLGNDYNTSHLVETVAGITTTGISTRKYQCFHCEIELNTEQYNYTSLAVLVVSFPTGSVGPVGPISLFIDSNMEIKYNSVVGKSGIYAIIDEETAAIHGIPTQIIISPAYH